MPILTIFTLTNFTLVFLSCVITVFILRLYHTPATFNSNEVRRLPYMVRIIVLKYLSKIVCSNKFKYDDTHDDNDVEIVINGNEDTTIDTTKFNNKIKLISSTLNENSNKILNNSLSLSNTATKMTKTKKTTITTSRRKSILEKTKTNNEALALNILLTLKSLKKYLIDINDLNDERRNSSSNNLSLKDIVDNNNDSNRNNINCKIKNSNSNAKFREEWKQAALIIDGIFFYLFLIIMPLTVTVFFKTNFYEYIISSNNIISSNVINEC